LFKCAAALPHSAFEYNRVIPSAARDLKPCEGSQALKTAFRPRTIHALFQAKMAQEAHGMCVIAIQFMH
jgi:hypothetical protein